MSKRRNQYRNDECRAPQQPATPRPGDLVYFHASLDPGDESNLIGCKGYLLKLPGRDSKTCKILITGINPDTITGETDISRWKLLLGKKLTRSSTNMSAKPAVWWSTTWIEYNNDTKIRECVNRYRK